MSERSYDRTPASMRPVEIEPGFVRTADGSALISVGETRVICTASISEGVPRWMRGKGRGWVSAEYAMLPASTGERKVRDSKRGATRRPLDRDPAPDRSLPPRGRRLRGARRARRVGRLRRPAGRRRHSLRLDHRRLRGPSPGARSRRRAGRAGQAAADRLRRRAERRHGRRRGRSAIWTTPRTPGPRSTRTSSWPATAAWSRSRRRPSRLRFPALPSTSCSGSPRPGSRSCAIVAGAGDGGVTGASRGSGWWSATRNEHKVRRAWRDPRRLRAAAAAGRGRAAARGRRDLRGERPDQGAGGPSQTRRRR